MVRAIVSVVIFVLGNLVVSGPPAMAASFDCAKASTPFERAICDSSELSAADERLAKTYATAIGGLSDIALGEMRKGQREWLDYARRACTSDAKPLTSGRYDDRGINCLIDLFGTRSDVLESSRMIAGIRFYPVSRYWALPDPYEADNPDSLWPVAQHELNFVQIDGNKGTDHAFNDTIREDAGYLSDGGTDNADEDSSSDTTTGYTVASVIGTGRITLNANTYWYGHGAAHGNWSITYRHYLVEQGRLMKGTDLFAGKGWKKALLDLTVSALRAEHGDALMLDDPNDIADSVADPERWDLSDSYGLVIQFQPYEVSAYAYGAPTARVSWEALEPYLAEDANLVRYGW